MEPFETLYKKYYNQVYLYLLRISRNEHIAEEITQETFFKVLEKLDTFIGDCRLSVWITQIAKNTYYSYCRRKKPDTERLPESLGSDKSPEDRLIEAEAADQVYMILHQMRDPYREVFCMRAFGELSFREIGHIHGKTESWARVTYHRARLMIKERLK